MKHTIFLVVSISGAGLYNAAISSIDGIFAYQVNDWGLTLLAHFDYFRRLVY